jgi:hypothetical protein
MSPKARPAFVRRPNRERRIESTCSKCNAVVATSQSRADLERAEKEHVCDARLLESQKKPPQPAHGKAPATRSDAA